MQYLLAWMSAPFLNEKNGKWMLVFWDITIFIIHSVQYESLAQNVIIVNGFHNNNRIKTKVVEYSFPFCYCDSTINIRIIKAHSIFSRIRHTKLLQTFFSPDGYIHPDITEYYRNNFHQHIISTECFIA